KQLVLVAPEFERLCRGRRTGGKGQDKHYRAERGKNAAHSRKPNATQSIERTDSGTLRLIRFPIYIRHHGNMDDSNDLFSTNGTPVATPESKSEAIAPKKPGAV